MVTIARQFNGPPNSGNGGWVSGLIAGAHLDHTVAGPGAVVSAKLRMPPPLNTPLAWEAADDETRLVTHGGAIVGVATDGAFRGEPPAPVDVDAAEAGRAAYPGFHQHPFDHCFTCGTERGPGDGLQIFSGPIGDGLTAAPWTPHPAFDDGSGRATVPVTWAALDCPGGWAADFNAQPMVLGTMTAQILRRPRIGEPLHCVGRLVSHDGRKFSTATAIHTPAGDLIGRSEQIWIEIELARFT